MLNNQYSTTRLLTDNQPAVVDDYCGNSLFVDPLTKEGREGGLRKQGLFKQGFPDKPLITIITVVFNNKKGIQKTINSIINQSYDNVEYIVIDGGSTDGTVGLIERYDHCIDYWVSEPDGGIYGAMNKGISLAQGDIIGLINSADFCGKATLGDIAKQYDEAVDVYYADVRIVFEAFDLIKTQKAHFNYCKGMPICHQSLFIHKRIYNKLGLYSLSYRFLSDYDFFMRMLKNNETSFKYVEAAKVYFQEGYSGSQHHMKVASESFSVARKYLPLLELVCFLGYWLKDLLWGMARKTLFTLLGERGANHARKLYQKIIGSK